MASQFVLRSTRLLASRLPNRSRHLSSLAITAKPQRHASKTLFATTREARSLHASTRLHAGLMPDTSDPPERSAEEHDTPNHRSEITLEDYHRHADQFLEKLVTTLEKRQEDKADVDAEYHVSLFTRTVGYC
jgi:hypothetical protein